MIQQFVLLAGIASITKSIEFEHTASCDNVDKVDITTYSNLFEYQSTGSLYFHCLTLADMTLPWPVDYTITVQMQSLSGSTPCIIFNYHDDDNYNWICFQTVDFNCVSAGRVTGNTNHAYSGNTCAGNYLSDSQWFEVVVDVSSATFEVSVNDWMILNFITGHSQKPTIGFTHRYGYEYRCSHACSYNFKHPTVLPKEVNNIYTYTETKNVLQLPDYGTSPQQNHITVMSIAIDNLGQPVGSYCFVSFFFKDYDIGVGELLILGKLDHESMAIETYSTNSPFIDVIFNSKTIDTNRRGFSIEYELLLCGVDNRNLDLSYFCANGNHIDLYEDFYRSTSNEQTAMHSDSSLSVGWYRFSSCVGNTIPTISPGQEHICGTQYPIWIKDETDGTVCLYKSGDECSQEWKIPIHDCYDPDFKLYYLTPSPENSGYCAGVRKKCNSTMNEFSLDGSGCVDGLEECVDGQVPEISRVEIDEEWLHSNPDEYTISCTIHGTINQHALFYVEWLVDFGTHRSIIKHSSDFEADDTTVLEFSLLKNEHLQNKLICMAKSKYSGSGHISDWHESLPVFIGMKIKGPTGPVSYKTEYITVDVIFTVPISADTANCHIDILFATKYDPDADELRRQDACTNLLFLQPDLVHVGSCSRQVNCAAWNQNGHNTILRVKNTLQPLPFTTYRHTLYAVTKSGDNTIWNNIVVDIEIFVDITDQNKVHTSSCRSENDPHFYPFSSQSEYDFHDVGEFVLYKSTPHDDTDMLTLVTILQTKCHLNQDLGEDGVACNVGVGIRVNDEAVLIDRTRKRGDERHYINIGPNTIKENGFSMNINNGNEYEIFLPRGEKVVVTLSENPDHRYLNVRVESRLEKQVETRNGLCGIIEQVEVSKFNDLVYRDGTICGQTNYPDKNRDLGRHILTDFGANWKAADSEKIIKECKLKPHVPHLQTDMFACKVKHWSDIVNLPDSQQFIFEKPSWDIERCLKTSDRSKSLMDDLREEPLSACKDSRKKRHSKTNRSPIKRDTKREVQEKWTNETAYAYCHDQIVDSSTGQACNELTPEEVTIALDQCAIDILISGSTYWTDGTLVSLRELCKDTLYSRLDLWTFEPNSTEFQPPPTIAAKLCPNDCSAHGECIGGGCNCYAGFIGTDCSLRIETPPTLEEILEGYICQFDELCDAMKIAGLNFVSRDELTCHFRAIEGTSEIIVDGSSLIDHTTTGYQFSYDVVSCPWPSFRSEGGYTTLSVGVSNDGVHVSGHLTGIAVSHAPCIACEENEDDEIVCALLPDWCLIENRCVPALNISSDNNCQYCDPESATHDWTVNLSLECSKQNHLKGLAIWKIALIAVGSATMIIIAFITIAIIVKKCLNKQKVATNPHQRYIRPDTPAPEIKCK